MRTTTIALGLAHETGVAGPQLGRAPSRLIAEGTGPGVRGKRIIAAALAAVALAFAGCTTTQQTATSEFRPPEGDYRLIVMRPHVKVSLLTAGGLHEPREDWTEQARGHVLTALQAQQAKRGGTAAIATSLADAGADPRLVTELERLHQAVGLTIRVHKYTPGMELPTKKNLFDWTLGQQAIEYGRQSGYDYALFLHAEDSFSSGGRVALQAVSVLGCVVGICYIPPGGMQIAFVSLVDLKTGQVVWYNFLYSEDGDIRTEKGASELVENLLDDMKPGTPGKKKG